MLFFLRWADAASVLLDAESEAVARAMGTAHAAQTGGPPPQDVRAFTSGLLLEVFDDCDDEDKSMMVVEPDEATAAGLAEAEFFGTEDEALGGALDALFCDSTATAPDGSVVACLLEGAHKGKHRNGKLEWE